MPPIHDASFGREHKSTRIKEIHMTNASFSTRFTLALAAGLAFSVVSGHAQDASATISYTTAGANYDYTITLFNTGTYDLNGFWYGWTDSGNNLPSDPASLGNSLGWDNNPDGNSVMWENTYGYGTAIAPGQSGTFTFESSSSPTDMTTGGAGASVAYVSSIDFSQNYPGDSTDAFTPVLETPEPSSAALLAAGIGIMAFGLRSRFLIRQ
jgi:hypothetical protein